MALSIRMVHALAAMLICPRHQMLLPRLIKG